MSTAHTGACRRVAQRPPRPRARVDLRRPVAGDQEGERGSRNEFIHWLQDFPTSGIVRQYVKYENEIRTPANIRQIFHRALQIAESEPKGPVYLTAGAVLTARRGSAITGPAGNERRAALPPAAGDAGRQARPRPPAAHVTSYLGRQPAAVDELVSYAPVGSASGVGAEAP